MVANITANRLTTLFTDQDSDGVIDPGDVVLTRIRISNTGTAATGVKVEDTLSGVTIDPTSVQITPIAYDDNFSITGNTPITLTAAQLVGNDDDPDGAEASLHITKIGNTSVVAGDGVTPISVTVAVTNGSITSNLDGTFTFTPTTGLDVNAVGSFTYTVTDAQGLDSVSLTPGIVTLTITDVVWYVDNTASAAGADGSYLHPFTSLTPLNNNGADVDAAGESIFVYHNGAAYTSGITLEASQKLIGDGQTFLVNGHNIGGLERSGGADVLTNSVISLSTGTGVILSTDNTVKGLTFDSTTAAAVGMADGGTSVTTTGGTLLVANVSFTGVGQAVDIDAGGKLNVTIDSLTSTGSANQGVQLAGTAASGNGLIEGTFTVTAGNIQAATSHDFLIGGLGPSSGGTIAVSYGGTIGSSINGSAVNINDRIAGAGDINFTGNIFQNSGASSTSAGIAIANIAAGNINFTGTKTITVTAGNQHAISINSQSGGAITFGTGAMDIDFSNASTGSAFVVGSQTGGSVTVSTAADIDFAGTASGSGIVVSGAGTPGGSVNFTGGGVTISTLTGDGVNVTNTNQGTQALDITGSGNTITTTTGQIIDITNGTTANGMQFTSLTSGSVASGSAISISNLDGAGSFNGGTVQIGGAAADGINISGSAVSFGFTSAKIDNTTGDGIEINGTASTQGAVTFGSVDLDTLGANGVAIVAATNAVNINGGTIGTTNDAFSNGLFVSLGSGAVTVAAAIGKTTTGNVVNISGHGAGNINLSGNIDASGTASGITLTNNTGGGAINFSGANINLNTAANNAINFTNTLSTGANVTFTGGNLNIDTTTGIGINATSTTVGAGSLTISGSNNVVDKTGSTNGAIFLQNVTANVNLVHVNHTVSTSSTVIYVKDNGATGSFVITGDAGGTDGSGGILNGSTGADGTPSTTGTGVYLENAANVVLEDMTFNGTYQNYGIYGLNVNNFTLRDSFLQGTYGTTDVGPGAEAAVKFGRTDLITGLRGTALFEGNTIQNGYADNLVVTTFGNNTLNLTIKDSASQSAVFNANNTTTGNDSVHIETGGTSNTTINIDGVQFTGSRGDQIQVVAVGNATQNVTIQNNTLTNSNLTALGGGIELGAGGVGNYTVTYNIHDNTIKGAVTTAIRPYFSGLNGTVVGIIQNNTIGTPLDPTYNATIATGAGSTQGFGIWAGIDKSNGGTVTHAVRIQGNTIADVGATSGGGIVVTSANGGASGTARLEATVTGNTVSQLHATNSFGAFYAKAGGGTTDDTAKVGLTFSNNTFTAAQNNAIVLDQVTQNAHFYSPGYSGSANGEFNIFGSAGTASTGLSQKWANAAGGGTGNNQLNNGVGPNVAGAKVDAITVFGVTGENFTMGVPILAAPVAPTDWESALLDQYGQNRLPDAPQPGSDTPDTSGGGGTTGGGDGGTGGGGDTGGGGSGGAPGGPPADDGILTQAELSTMLEVAIQKWIEAGASDDQIAAMRAVKVGIIDMSGIYIGSAETGVINVDSDAAGHGWFVDTTPGDNSEYYGTGTDLEAVAGGAAAGKVDLLTVLMHELGHQIGLQDTYQTLRSADLMYGYINPSERKLATEGQAAGSAPGVVHEAYALGPITVGGLPANKMVDVFFKSTVNAQTNGFIINPFNTATVTADGGISVTATETMVLDSLTLGNAVWLDSDKDGVFDAGEGKSGVALKLYADTNNDQNWDVGDAFLADTTTLANGAYSFVGLAPGNYIVVVTAANFTSGQPLANLLIKPGTAADPDDNVNNDNNGVAIAGGAVASYAITLSYGAETVSDGGVFPKNDINDTLDFVFVANSPPTAVDDNGLTATEDQQSQYSTELTGNDTDPDSGDTLTITGAGNATNGSVSVSAGVVTFTPNANFNGTATFEYTIDDGHGHQDVGLATVTVGAVNDPVTGTVTPTANLNEDATNVAITGMSIADVDAALAPAGVYDVTLTATHGTMTLTTTTGLTFGTGTGTGDVTMVFHGTLADINTALATAKYTPDANYNGSAGITLQVTDQFGATVATGTGSSTSDSDPILISITAINDTPVLTVADTGTSTEQVAGKVDAAATISDIDLDALNGGSGSYAGSTLTFANNGGASATDLFSFASSGAFTVNGSNLEAGGLVFATFTGGNGSALVISFTGTGTPATTARVNAVLQSVQYTYTGNTPPATVDISVGFNDGAPGNGQGSVASNPATDTEVIQLTLTDTPEDSAAVVDLDASGAGTGFASSYTEGGAAAAISDTDVLITDADSGDDIVSATITITNPETGDKLNVGTLPVGITVHGSSTDTMVKLVAAAGTSAADFEAAIEAVTYSSTSDDPTDHGTNTSRSITVTVNDGDLDSAAATATVTVTDVNDAPSGTSSTISASEDTYRTLTATDFGTNDVDGVFGGVTISGVTGGKIYFDSDGAGGADPVEATLPHTYTELEVSAGKLSFKANSNLNGNGVATITFTVQDDDGANAASTNLLTVNVAAVNDSPVVPDSPDAAVNEGSGVTLMPALNVSDVDLDARNGGNGDYGGAQFVMNRSGGGNPQDQFFLTNANAVGFTVTGTILGGGDLQSGGQTFGNWIWDSGTGTLTINFTSSQTAATSALVDAVLQAIQYNVVSDTPPASVDLVYTLNDGSPGGGQGTGASATDSGAITVNITPTNDGPWLDLLDPGASTDVSINYTENDPATVLAPTASVADPDMLDFDTGKLTVNLAPTGVTAEDRLTIVNQGMGSGQVGVSGANVYYGGVLIGTFTGGTDGATPLVVTFNASADQTAVAAVVRQVAYTNVSDAPTTTDRVIGFDLTDGDGGQSNLATATVHIAATQDAPVAQPDAVSTPENVIGTGSLFVNNGSGPDVDADGDTLTIASVQGGSLGVPFALPSGAILTVNADGTYSYNPNGKFTTLTDNSSGAVNTSTVGDTFQYTLTGGNTVTVTVTVNGVAGPGDWLAGDSGDNTITGTPQSDFFFLVQGGDDTVVGLASDDVFFFGGALTSGDKVDGDGGTDQIALQGDYSGGVTLGTQVVSVESIGILAGNDTRFGAPGTQFYDYVITTVNENVASGQQMVVDANRLRVGEDFTFNGSAETDGSFFIYGGKGTDTLTGGGKNDVFLFGAEGQWGSSDTIIGGAGLDQLALRGDYTITFGATQLVSIESFGLLSAYDTRFGALGERYNYDLTMNDGNVALGVQLTIDGAKLRPDETLHFNGSAENDGTFRVFGGQGDDVIVGGKGADIITGGLGFDVMTGGLGNDTFRFVSTADSTSAARDSILDFSIGDVVDLSRIDANTQVGAPGDQAFSFIGTDDFHGVAGELRFQLSSGNIWLVQGDTDGNGVSDFEFFLVVTDSDPITSGDFIL